MPCTTLKYKWVPVHYHGSLVKCWEGGNVLLNLNLYYKGKYKHLTGNLKGVCEVYVLRLGQCIQSHNCWFCLWVGIWTQFLPWGQELAQTNLQKFKCPAGCQGGGKSWGLIDCIIRNEWHPSWESAQTLSCVKPQKQGMHTSSYGPLRPNPMLNA